MGLARVLPAYAKTEHIAIARAHVPGVKFQEGKCVLIINFRLGNATRPILAIWVNKRTTHETLYSRRDLFA